MLQRRRQGATSDRAPGTDTEGPGSEAGASHIPTRSRLSVNLGTAYDDTGEDPCEALALNERSVPIAGDVVTLGPDPPDHSFNFAIISALIYLALGKMPEGGRDFGVRSQDPRSRKSGTRPSRHSSMAATTLGRPISTPAALPRRDGDASRKHSRHANELSTRALPTRS